MLDNLKASMEADAKQDVTMTAVDENPTQFEANFGHSHWITD